MFAGGLKKLKQKQTKKSDENGVAGTLNNYYYYLEALLLIIIILFSLICFSTLLILLAGIWTSKIQKSKSHTPEGGRRRRRHKMWRRVASLSPMISSSSPSRSLARNQVRRFPLRFSIPNRVMKPLSVIFGLLWILTQFITYSRQLLGSTFENHLQRRLVNRYVHIKRSCSFYCVYKLVSTCICHRRKGRNLHSLRLY